VALGIARIRRTVGIWLVTKPATRTVTDAPNTTIHPVTPPSHDRVNSGPGCDSNTRGHVPDIGSRQARAARGGLKKSREAGRQSNHTAAAPASQATTNSTVAP